MTVKITVFQTGPIDLQPASPDRGWMDNAPSRFPNRCLPLRIANAHGWTIRLLETFQAIWTGGGEREAVSLVTPSGVQPQTACSHFGGGVLTFSVPAVIRTPPGYDLFVTGPVNACIDGIVPLSGVVETDWSDYSFTMNWRFTRPDVRVQFNAGDPFCHFFPIKRQELEEMETEITPIDSDPRLAASHRLWAEGRDKFNADLHVPDSDAAKRGWEKQYFRGVNPDGSPGPDDHRTKVKICPFRP
jgi:Family of unknown function (DUF6065)